MHVDVSYNEETDTWTLAERLPYGARGAPSLIVSATAPTLVDAARELSWKVQDARARQAAQAKSDARGEYGPAVWCPTCRVLTAYGYDDYRRTGRVTCAKCGEVRLKAKPKP